jgi:hypothetical protein
MYALDQYCCFVSGGLITLSFFFPGGQINAVSEGDAQRYFEHALTLRDTIRFLRHNRSLGASDSGDETDPAGVDLLRLESLNSLDAPTLYRVLSKNYCALISMAPISCEVPTVTTCSPLLFGPQIPEVNSIWFRLYVYTLAGAGPPSVLFPMGHRVKTAPGILKVRFFLFFFFFQFFNFSIAQRTFRDSH